MPRITPSLDFGRFARKELHNSFKYAELEFKIRAHYDSGVGE